MPNEYQHQPSREIFTKLFKLIRKNTSNGHVTKYSDTVLKNKDSSQKIVKYCTQNPSLYPEVKKEDQSYLNNLCTIKNKIFKCFYYLIIFFVLCICLNAKFISSNK